jgi:hypothetical protein
MPCPRLTLVRGTIHHRITARHILSTPRTWVRVRVSRLSIPTSCRQATTPIPTTRITPTSPLHRATIPLLRRRRPFREESREVSTESRRCTNSTLAPPSPSTHRMYRRNTPPPQFTGWRRASHRPTPRRSRGTKTRGTKTHGVGRLRSVLWRVRGRWRGGPGGNIVSRRAGRANGSGLRKFCEIEGAILFESAGRRGGIPIVTTE